MTTFDDRERAHEAKFAHDADLRFKAGVRRDRMLGEWAAGLLGLTGDAARDYAMSVVRANFDEAGDEDLVRKLSADLAGHADEATIRRRLSEMMDEARRQVMDDAR